MIILIPCYKPDGRLLALVEALRAADATQRVVLVDDGSGPDYGDVFGAAQDAGCDIVGYETNRGKGAALKHGFAYVAECYPREDVVCADGDGQHTPTDIRRVGAALPAHPGAIVLGSRRFVGDVPARNRYGNAITSVVFGTVTGQWLQDTQTGLRCYPGTMIPWLLSLPGERYEYELQILLAARRADVAVVEVPIATVYLDDNRSSHMRFPWDPIRIYLPFVRFSASSLWAFVLDASLLFLFLQLTGSLLFSVVGARVAGVAVNYAVKGRLDVVAASRFWAGRSSRLDVGLAAALLGANYAVLRTLITLSVPVAEAKVATELTLFVLCGWLRRRFVSGPTAVPPAGRGAPAPGVAATGPYGDDECMSHTAASVPRS